MKKLFLSLLSLACISLEATHFQSSMSITSINNGDAFLVEIQIEKVHEVDSTPELIACPKIICVKGEPTEIKIESEDKSDLFFVRVTVPENISQTGIQTSVFMKEKGLVVLSFDNTIKLDPFNPKEI